MDTITYRAYSGEHELPHIISLVESELSEPYVVYTYRYFLHQWSVPTSFHLRHIAQRLTRPSFLPSGLTFPSLYEYQYTVSSLMKCSRSFVGLRRRCPAPGWGHSLQTVAPPRAVPPWIHCHAQRR